MVPRRIPRIFLIVIPHYLFFNKTAGEDSVHKTKWNQDDQETQIESTQNLWFSVAAPGLIKRADAMKFTAVYSPF